MTEYVWYDIDDDKIFLSKLGLLVVRDLFNMGMFGDKSFLYVGEL